MAQTNKDTKRLEILVVDDDPTITSVVGEMLGLKHNVTTTCDVWEAVDFLAADKYDVLLTDFKMPGINGATLSDIARKEMRYTSDKTTIIMLTGTDIEKEHPGARSIDYVLRKPIQWSKMNDVINEIVERKSHGADSTV